MLCLCEAGAEPDAKKSIPMRNENYARRSPRHGHSTSRSAFKSAYFFVGHDESEQRPWTVAYVLRKVELLSFYLQYIVLQILLGTTITNEENGPE
jgi:hypothetical protein